MQKPFEKFIRENHSTILRCLRLTPSVLELSHQGAFKQNLIAAPFYKQPFESKPIIVFAFEYRKFVAGARNVSARAKNASDYNEGTKFIEISSLSYGNNWILRWWSNYSAVKDDGSGLIVKLYLEKLYYFIWYLV